MDIINKSKKACHGFSLIELMISIALGLILLAALTVLFVNQNKTRNELDKANRMIDNGRYALDLLTDNLRMAGFYGELDPLSVYTTSTSISTIPVAAFNPCSTAAADITQGLVWHIQGFNAATASVSAASPPTCVPSTLKAGSDILVVRRANTSTVAAASAVAGTTYLQVSLCTPQTGTETSYMVAKAAATFNLSKRTCTAANGGPAADLRRMLVQIYFIDSNDQPGDGIPTLKVAELDGTSTFVVTPLVEGIEYMQVDYGIDGKDTDSDGIPDRFDASLTPPDTDGIMNGTYISCATCNVNQWAHVVSVKINLISRNLIPTNGYSDTKTYQLGSVSVGPFNDSYKRHAYTQVVRLINPASRRE